MELPAYGQRQAHIKLTLITMSCCSNAQQNFFKPLFFFTLGIHFCTLCKHGHYIFNVTKLKLIDVLLRRV